ncbi:hypothetical protein AMTRI_Chr03g45860 [Amborella trichopoda]
MAMSINGFSPPLYSSSFFREINRAPMQFSPDRPEFLSGQIFSSKRQVLRRCSTISESPLLELGDDVQRNLSLLKPREKKGSSPEREDNNVILQKQVERVKERLSGVGNGEISVSAYDTAWVALVPDMSTSGWPQFPSSLRWIAKNQLSDGSWGDSRIFSAHDRIINTLACVIALKTWNICPEKTEQGRLFLVDNMWRLEGEKAEHMPIGFEVAFPSLVSTAAAMGLDLPYHSAFLKKVHEMRQFKLQRIPKETMHNTPTTLLHSLEGMVELDWDKLLRLRCSNGSFLFSPSATAFALIQTKDQNCLRYLQRVVNKFDGGVPNAYPVDLFERLWSIDRLERLGITRYFESEIRDYLHYVYRYWTEQGICWARNSNVQDVDDTAMAFRLLRLHGYDVSADVFQYFKKGEEFFCFFGQSNQAVTGIYNLNRASQLLFPGETILEEAKEFSYKFLREKQASNQLLDKWIITKDLVGEVEYALDFPFYASQPRVETRYYLEQYGGEDDVWIGKTLYRMPFVNNADFLELARLDFNRCQFVHQTEWHDLQRWYAKYNLGDLQVSQNSVLEHYFVAATAVFEVERRLERLGWAQSAVLMDAVYSYFTDKNRTAEENVAFVEDLRRGLSMKTEEGLQGVVSEIIDFLSLSTLLSHGRDISRRLRSAWETWLLSLKDEGGAGVMSGEAALLVSTCILCSGRPIPESMVYEPRYTRLAGLANSICSRLRHLRTSLTKMRSGSGHEIDREMKELVQGVVEISDAVDVEVRRTFLRVVKGAYYYTFCPPATINLHIHKVLFETVP